MFWYNGQIIKENTINLLIDEPGLIYGATVFTTLRIYHQSLNHPLTNWDAHCARLLNSLQTFEWELPDWNRIRQGAEELLLHFPVLRIVIFPDGREWITG
ncbi:MAG TPA: 4-amino-4-deoxychorismate lyase, partial [Cyanobacteria bacterium UBA11153]|nr:4-amino-4-deoxychorismate lyase [Cyanobacteria bacterium UBA11153]